MSNNTPTATFPLPMLKAPVMLEAEGDVINYDSASAPSPLEFNFPGLQEELPGLHHIGVILTSNGGGSGYTLWPKDALQPQKLIREVEKHLYSPGTGLRVAGSLTFMFDNGDERKVSIPERIYQVV
ncbi:hypothetical protein QSV36_21415 [Pseudomonas sp. BCRC 81390]|uniref:hypothetical protein n=1 Tax=Pseudomonas sp. BCRC 81390 TaxID=3054778 RepID=UPI0025938D74|nr:hypothetical protein [Pseudomonas sp. BCRC 81390]MDM3888136.1 hypothetical protein [Pseudomonas sp. BCRC 81390]